MTRQTLKKLIIGLVLLALGAGWLGSALDLWSFNVFFDGWWAALLMFCFLISVVGDGPNVGNVLGLLIFGALVLRYNGIVPDSVNLWLVAFALAVIVLGGAMLVNAFRGGRKRAAGKSCKRCGKPSEGTSTDGGRYVSYAFTGETLHFAGETIHACVYGVSFGSLTLDFSGAVFAEDAYLSVSANFGEVKIILPPGMKAEAAKNAAFAAVKNDSTGNVSVKCSFDCAFGCIRVTNG